MRERVLRRAASLAIEALFALLVFQAATRPLTLHEAVLWDHLVRPPLRQAFVAPDAWRGLLYATAAKPAIGIFRLSEFTLRLPALIAGAVYLFVIARRARPMVAITIAIPPFALGWFSTATPHGIASPVFAVPLAVLAAWQIIRCGIAILERIVIPAITAAFVILIVPLSHAAALAEWTLEGREESAVRTALRSLRDHGPIRISVPGPFCRSPSFTERDTASATGKSRTAILNTA